MARYALLLAVAMGVYLLATYMEKRVNADHKNEFLLLPWWFAYADSLLADASI